MDVSYYTPGIILDPPDMLDLDVYPENILIDPTSFLVECPTYRFIETPDKTNRDINSPLPASSYYHHRTNKIITLSDDYIEHFDPISFSVNHHTHPPS